MNFFSPLCAKDFPAFDIIPNALPSGTISDIYNNIIADLQPAHPGQSGSVLTRFNKLYAFLRPLEETISRRFGRSMFLRLDKSSYRTQLPSGEGALALHQDYLPLQELLLKRFHRSTRYYTDPAREPCCTVWVPLVDIDEFTPTLAVSTVLPPAFVPHKPDAAGYLILTDQGNHDDQPMVEFTRLKAGTGVFLTSLTLHRSSVHPWHTRTRTSFDLRFLPRPEAGRWHPMKIPGAGFEDLKAAWEYLPKPWRRAA